MDLTFLEFLSTFNNLNHQFCRAKWTKFYLCHTKVVSAALSYLMLNYIIARN